MPQALADQGVLFTDFHTALEEIPQVVEDYFMSSVKYDDDKLAAYHTAYFNSGAVLYVQTTSKFQNQSKVFFYQDSDSDVPFNKHILIIAGKTASLAIWNA